MAAAPRSVAYVCPICSTGVPEGAVNRYRPFCSARCQRIDLGNWLGEHYAVPGETVSEEASEGEEGGKGAGTRAAVKT